MFSSDFSSSIKLSSVLRVLVLSVAILIVVRFFVGGVWSSTPAGTGRVGRHLVCCDVSCSFPVFPVVVKFDSLEVVVFFMVTFKLLVASVSFLKSQKSA